MLAAYPLLMVTTDKRNEILVVFLKKDYISSE